MKRRKNSRRRAPGKRRQSRAIRPNLRNGAPCCNLLHSLKKALSPILGVFGIK